MVQKVITEVIEKFREVNPEALTSKNGDKVLKPSWQMDKIAQNKIKWDAMTPEERDAQQEVYNQRTWEER